MSEKLMAVIVRGERHTWRFRTMADPRYLQEWREDGIEIYEVCNTIPIWVPAWAIRPWCIAQDIFNFKNPWGEQR